MSSRRVLETEASSQLLRSDVRGYREGSVTESTCYSCRGIGFGSYYLHGGSQLFVTSVPGDLIIYSGLFGQV